MRRQEQTINAASTRVSEKGGRESYRRGLAKERGGTAVLNASGQCAVAVVTSRL